MNEGSILTVYICVYMLTTLAGFQLAAQDLAMQTAHDFNLEILEQAYGPSGLAKLEQLRSWAVSVVDIFVSQLHTQPTLHLQACGHARRLHAMRTTYS